jgi:hypothetical protein
VVEWRVRSRRVGIYEGSSAFLYARSHQLFCMQEVVLGVFQGLCGVWIINRHMQMTGDSRYFSEEEDDMPQAHTHV